MTIRAKMDSCHIHVASQAGCQETFKSAKDSYCFMVKESTLQKQSCYCSEVFGYYSCVTILTMQIL